jgi:hypothetical protein
MRWGGRVEGGAVQQQAQPEPWRTITVARTGQHPAIRITDRHIRTAGPARMFVLRDDALTLLRRVALARAQAP